MTVAALISPLVTGSRIYLRLSERFLHFCLNCRMKGSSDVTREAAHIAGGSWRSREARLRLGGIASLVRTSMRTRTPECRWRLKTSKGNPLFYYLVLDLHRIWMLAASTFSHWLFPHLWGAAGKFALVCRKKKYILFERVNLFLPSVQEERRRWCEEDPKSQLKHDFTLNITAHLHAARVETEEQKFHFERSLRCSTHNKTYSFPQIQSQLVSARCHGESVNHLRGILML